MSRNVAFCRMGKKSARRRYAEMARNGTVWHAREKIRGRAATLSGLEVPQMSHLEKIRRASSRRPKRSEAVAVCASLRFGLHHFGLHRFALHRFGLHHFSLHRFGLHRLGLHHFGLHHSPALQQSPIAEWWRSNVKAVRQRTRTEPNVYFACRDSTSFGMSRRSDCGAWGYGMDDIWTKCEKRWNLVGMDLRMKHSSARRLVLTAGGFRLDHSPQPSSG